MCSDGIIIAAMSVAGKTTKPVWFKCIGAVCFFKYKEKNVCYKFLKKKLRFNSIQKQNLNEKALDIASLWNQCRIKQEFEKPHCIILCLKPKYTSKYLHVFFFCYTHSLEGHMLSNYAATGNNKPNEKKK